MADANPQEMEVESPLIAAAPAHVRLTQRQRSVLVFLMFAVPFWIILVLLAISNYPLLLAFLAGLGLLIAMYALRTEYFLILWIAIIEYSILLKAIGIGMVGIGIKGIFFAAVLTQLPNKFSLMPRRLFRTVPVRWPLYLFLLWTGASLFWSSYPLLGLRVYIRWILNLFLFGLVFLTVNERNRRLLLIAFTVIVGSSVLFGFLQRFGFGIPLVDTDLFTAREFGVGHHVEMFRASGLSGHPNGLGRECMFTLSALLVILFSWRLRPVLKVAVVAMMVVTLVTIVLSYSRIAWGLFAVGLFVFLVLTRPRWLLIAAAVAVVVAVAAWPQVSARIDPILYGTDTSMASRELASSIYLDYWRQSPLTGHGFGSTGGGAFYEVGIGPHEGYVYVLTYFGLIGLVLYAGLLAALVRKAWQMARSPLRHLDEETRCMMALGCAVVAMVVVEFIAGVSLYFQVWYMLGLSFGSFRLAQQRVRREAMQRQTSGAVLAPRGR
jgi:O-antigen ligase